jgi:hypothetical protein
VPRKSFLHVTLTAIKHTKVNADYTKRFAAWIRGSFSLSAVASWVLHRISFGVRRREPAYHRVTMWDFGCQVPGRSHKPDQLPSARPGWPATGRLTFLPTNTLDAIRRPRNTALWKLEASLKCRSCRKGRYAPPVHMIKLTEQREISPYKWVHPDGDR